ncbi:MAG TPA: cysteine desulfurase [Dehalococcoidia bacterium]|jgi:cysteine desulfurase/selenocysteine lyase|nr:cysteine desulfurase [Dehalococcoidia bacterium]
MTLDVAQIRRDFPILQRQVHGKPLVYLDNAATSQKPRQVIDALVRYYETTNANIHRAVHTLGEEATAEYEEAREKVRRFINAPTTESVIFTRNTTESINLVAYSWGRANIREGDEILLTQMEHHSNLIPWQLLAREKGATVRYVPVAADGTLELNGFENLFDARTKMMALPHVSNSLGTINPVERIAAEARRHGVMLLIDGAQGAPHLPVDVHAIGADFYAFSSHKMLGPTGVGVLYGRKELLEEMEPFLGGGEMIRKVTFEGATWNDLPWKFEAGTPNIADVIAFGAAIDYLEALGMENVRAHEAELTAYALDRMAAIPDITLYGPTDIDQRGGVVSFNFPDLHPHDIGTVLDQYGVAIRSGHHCTQPLWRCLGVSGSARASFYVYNTPGEVDALVDAVKAARSYFAER